MGKMETNSIIPKQRKKLFRNIVIVVVVVNVLVGLLLFAGNFTILLDDNSFTVDATGWKDMTVNFEDVRGIEYRETDAALSGSNRKSNGFSSTKVLLGTFRNAVYGNYERYTFESCKSYVIIQLDDTKLVINGKTKEETEFIYNSLKEILKK